VRSGPIHTQALDVLELLGDPARCQVVLVTLPETTPVNELVETAYALEERVGVQLGPVVVNGVDEGDDAGVPDRRTHRQPDAPPRPSSATPAGRCTDASCERLATTGAAAAAPAARGDGRRSRRRRRERAGARGPGLDAHEGHVSPTRRPGRPHWTVPRCVVCCGSGGVGKTTTAAALGLELARRGGAPSW
jgi:hypothetical protein